MTWNNGFWWPLYTTAWYSPHVSQYMFDPYSLINFSHGIILQIIPSKSFPRPPVQQTVGGFLFAMLLQVVWEVVQNTEPVMNMMTTFSENSGASKEFGGESVQNMIGDLVSCAGGFILAASLQMAEMGWVSFVWVVISEIACILYMRDSWGLIIFNLAYKSEALLAWQEEGIPGNGKES